MKTIAESAEEFGVSQRTIRYYEEIGLLHPERTAANKRLYSKAEMAKLKLIFRGKRYGFSLEEIKEMVLLFDQDRTGKKQLEVTVDYGRKRIAEIEATIAEFQEMKQEMEALLTQFENKLNQFEGEKAHE
ncbi:MerR family DNA-binding transcriptional regulator [Halobacillus salinarum]|uniref:MerR family DNA-binding transcriptional regulator n=1 Tax=Halobacillus salinarum TaxID=2932257 RepID=UPI0037C1509B